MITFDDIMETIPIPRIFASSFILIAIFIFPLYYFIGDHQIPIQRIIISGALMSLIFSMFMSFIIWLTRKISVFYEECNQLEDKIRNVKYRDEIGELYKKELLPLREKAFDKGTRRRVGEIEYLMRHIIGWLPKKKPIE